jgi:hypothetical protein
MSIVKQDDFVRALREDPLFTDYPFEVRYPSPFPCVSSCQSTHFVFFASLNACPVAGAVPKLWLTPCVQVRALDGTVKTVTGVYVITDGGYHRWRVTQSPISGGFASGQDDVRWNEWLESVRKDVERTFGILKKRFRILKVSPLHTADLARKQLVLSTQGSPE